MKNTDTTSDIKNRHPADVTAALWKAGTSFRKLDRLYGMPESSINVCQRKRWPRAALIVARTLGEEPWDIWPEFYSPERDTETFRLLEEDIHRNVIAQAVTQNQKKEPS